MTRIRFGAPLLAIACISTILVSACGARTASTRATVSRQSPAVQAIGTVVADPMPVAATVGETPADNEPPTVSACNAPSLLGQNGADDSGDRGAPADCSADDAWGRAVEEEQAVAARCETAGRNVDLARLLEGALPLDAETTEHVRRLFRAGQAGGRRADAFGLVGDSMTVAWNFLAPFAQGAGSALVPTEVERTLALTSPIDGAGDVLALFRTHRHGGSKPFGWDPFIAPRAAKVGARANWPLTPRGPQQPSPLDEMVRTVSPAYAVVLYGANDAVWQSDSIDSLVGDYSRALSAIVDALEARAVVPVLTTVPRHRRARGWPDCARAPGAQSNERFARQATALSAAVADVACRRHLPLIDLRWSLEPLINSGVGADGVHLSAHRGGGGVLDKSGLQCGYNVRNLVTLRELALIVDAVSAPPSMQDR